MPKRTPNKYSGTLASPIPFRIILQGAIRYRGSQEDGLVVAEAEARAWLNDEIALRFSLLMIHHGISPDSPDKWFQLATALAYAHVPGLSLGEIIRKVGPPRKNFGRLRRLAPGYVAPIRGRRATFTDDEVKKFAAQMSDAIPSSLHHGRGTRKAALMGILEKHAIDTGRAKSNSAARTWAKSRFNTAKNRLNIDARK